MEGQEEREDQCKEIDAPDKYYGRGRQNYHV